MMLAGYSKKGRKARRTKRSSKRRGFGSSPEVHRRRIRSSARDFRHSFKMLSLNLQDGDCGRAFSRLKLLYRTEGEFIAGRQSVTGISFPRKGGMTRQLERASKRFATLCVR